MKWLVIDRTKTYPIRGVVVTPELVMGSTKLLESAEIAPIARWLGVTGLRELLDAFELQLIRDGALHIDVVDENGFLEPMHSLEAVEIRRHDNGTRIVWERTEPCEDCDGDGHHNLDDAPVDEEDLCASCGGVGRYPCGEFETDLDGNVIVHAGILR